MPTGSADSKALAVHLATLICLWLCAPVFTNQTAQAQNSPCMYPPGQLANVWSAQNQTPLGSALRKAIAARKSSWPKAEQLFQDALSEADKLPDSDPCKASAYFFASLFFRGTNLEKAIALQQRTVALDEASLGPGPRLALDLSSLASLYEEERSTVKAEEYYKQALAMMENSPGLTELSRMGVLAAAAGFYERQKKYAVAENLFARALDVSESIPPNMGPYAADMRRQLAGVLVEEGKSEEANELLGEPSVPVYAGPPPGIRGRVVNVSGPLSELDAGILYESEGRREDAELSYDRATEGFEATHAPAAQRYVSLSLSYLGRLLRAEGRNVDAETTLLRAVSVEENFAATPSGGKWAANVIPGLVSLMDLYQQEGRRRDLEPILKHALEVQEQALGQNDLNLCLTLQLMGENYMDEEKYEQAIPVYEHELAIEEAHYGSNNSRLLGILEPYSEALQRVNEPEQAAKVRNRIREIQKKQ